MRTLMRLLPMLLVVASPLFLGDCASPPSQEESSALPDSRPQGTEKLVWSFTNGLFPDGWGWGEWYAEDGDLIGCHDSGWTSAYFTPYPCPENFAIETRVMFLSSLEGEQVEAQLLVRDDEGLLFESGLVLHTGLDVVSCRHMVRKKDLLYERYPTDNKIEYNRWYSLYFSLNRGKIHAELDGAPIPVPDIFYPFGSYREPHLAVKNGCARFDYVRILSLP